MKMSLKGLNEYHEVKMEIKHKTIALDLKVQMNPDERAKMIDETVNAFLDVLQKTMKHKNQTNLEVLEKSTDQQLKSRRDFIATAFLF